MGAAQAGARASLGSKSRLGLGLGGGLGVVVGVCEGGKKERQGQDGETGLVSSVVSPAQIPSFASLLPRRPFLLPTAPPAVPRCANEPLGGQRGDYDGTTLVDRGCTYRNGRL